MSNYVCYSKYTKNFRRITGMKKVINKIYRGIFCMAMLATTVLVNATCAHKLYQEELPEELGKLRKHD